MVRPPAEVLISEVPGVFQPYRYPLPREADLARSSALFFCPLLMSAIRIPQFFEIMCDLYLEYSVIFVSPNLGLLTSVMYPGIFTKG